jgi:acetyltransferase-like isoleucine patch superfamily enzyme
MRTLPWDWYEGTIPDNVHLDPEAYLETTFSFLLYRSEAAVGIRYARGAHSYLGTMFDVGPAGRVTLGEHALVHGVRIVCDDRVEIGDHAMLSWNVVLMDTYRMPHDPAARRALLGRLAVSASLPRQLPAAADARPVVIGPNTWIGFDACVMPGVTVGRGAVVGAKSVVFDDVPEYTVVAGNPARPIRSLEAP